MEYSGKNKEAATLQPGDFITTTGYRADVSEVEDINPVGHDKVHVTTTNSGATWKADKLIRIYR